MGDEINNWGKSLDDINALHKQREDLRKIYDHYDEKMEKMVKERFEKANKKIPETSTEEKKFERVKLIKLNQIIN